MSEALFEQDRQAMAQFLHEMWGDWVLALFAQCSPVEDGRLVVSASVVKDAKRLAETYFDDLSEADKRVSFERADSLIDLFEEMGYETGR